MRAWNGATQGTATWRRGSERRAPRRRSWLGLARRCDRGYDRWCATPARRSLRSLPHCNARLLWLTAPCAARLRFSSPHTCTGHERMGLHPALCSCVQLQIILSGAVSWYLTSPNNLRRVREARSHPLSALAFGRRHATGRSVQCGAGKAAPRSLPCPVAGTVRRVCALQLLTWRWAWLALVSVPLPLGVLLWSGGRGTGPHRSRVADLAAHPCVPCGMGRAARTRAPSTDQHTSASTIS